VTTDSKGVETILDEVTGLLAQMEKYQRLLTVMFTDIVGSTSYFERHGDVMGMLLLQKTEGVLRPQVLAHDGKVVKTIGDAIMAYFENPVQAVECGMEMQRALEEYNLKAAESEPVEIRVAINLGMAILRDKDVYGDVVNVCSRIEHEAGAGQVCVSPSVVEAVQQEKRFVCRMLKPVSLRGKAQKMDLYEVEWRADTPPDTPPPTILSNDQIVLAAGATTRAPDELRTMIAHVASGETAMTTLAKLTSVEKEFALLEVLPGGKLGERYVVQEPCTVAGGEKADIALPGPFVAAQHATFTPLGGALYVDDVSDGQGVFARVRKAHHLSDGEMVAVGRQRFRFQISEAGADGASKAALVRLSEDGKTEELPVERGETTLGRKDCTYTFPDDRYLSRLHARLQFFGRECFLEDLGSSNGTFVAIHERHNLDEDDEVLIGENILRVSVDIKE
jgi:class 3 adenylate cyclase/pSer/pThr/pTyr-binding forkhead associated (FHA) protein